MNEFKARYKQNARLKSDELVNTFVPSYTIDKHKLKRTLKSKCNLNKSLKKNKQTN